MRRFATEGERDAYIEAQPWQEYVRERGWAVRPSPFASSRVPASFELHLRDDANGGYVHLVAHPQGDTHVARFLEAVPGRGIVNREMSLLADEWARFEAELRLLDATDHEQVELLDGLMLWRRFGASTYSEADPWNTALADLSYFVPRFDSDADLLRLLLVAERLIGRGPGLSIPEGFDAIPAERDQLEHLVLAAVRRWAEEAEVGQLDLGKLTETQFENGLMPHLQRLTSARKQVTLRKSATRPPVLDSWPGVGSLDIELSALSPPVWLELKWAKVANTLHNCLWDAGKLAQALREHKASFGYLLAGAPVSEWNRRVPPAQLFDVSNHRGRSLVEDYPTWWAGWARENLNTYPLTLPTPVITVPVGHVRLDGPEDPWLIKLARIEAPGDASYTPPWTFPKT